MVRPGAAPVTLGLTIVSVAAFVLARLIWPADFVSEQLGFIPLRVSAAAQGFVVPLALTPLSCTLAHGDMWHLGLNMLMLVWCGRGVETVIGPWPMLVLYGVGAYLAAAAQWLVEPGSIVPMIGASGAISGVLAVYALLFGRNEVKRIGPIPAHWVRALWLALAWTGVQWMIGLATRGGGYEIATAAHIGGFLAGLALARPLLAWRYRGA
ncbi:MAG: rhomboid family intramembrane serine protease [Sphingomonadaceae bacterium]